MVRRNPTIGLLPFYLKLYDDRMPERREGFRAFLELVGQSFADRGIDVVPADICCVADEFGTAIQMFESQDVDCVVTLHLAYSPSLEALDAVRQCELPLLILDTTMDAAFGTDVAPDRIMYNHGVHGVMDFASMLRRHGRPFEIVAGHVTESGVMDRAAGIVRAAYAARCFRSTRALRIGEAFAGMGDFAVDEMMLRQVLGIHVEQITPRDVEHSGPAVMPREIDEELKLDRARYTCKAPEEVHRRAILAGLTLRQKLESDGFSAFSMNFLAFDSPEGAMCTVPFLEASKAMERGIGYAGEGDVLTAALVGALQRGFGRTTFTEVFCPDWKGNSLFLSHMGEVNPEVAAGKPDLVEMDYKFSAAKNPALLTCAPKPGPAVFVNLAPGPQDSFALIVAPVEVLGDTTTEALKKSIRGWIRPRCGVEKFLEGYAHLGGTHHSALVLGDAAEAVAAFGRFAWLDSYVIA
jgi:L-arabinose isomerase